MTLSSTPILAKRENLLLSYSLARHFFDFVEY